MKVYRTTVMSKGTFYAQPYKSLPSKSQSDKVWSSNLCSVKIGYKPDKDKMFFLKVYSQQSKTGTWIKPHFTDKQLAHIKDKVRWNYNKFVLNTDSIIREKHISTNKHHIEDKCERCIELDNYCKNGHKNDHKNKNSLRTYK